MNRPTQKPAPERAEPSLPSGEHRSAVMAHLTRLLDAYEEAEEWGSIQIDIRAGRVKWVLPAQRIKIED